MATTSIMPLHTGKGRSVRRAIQDSINYVKNPDKTDEGRLVTSYQCNGEIADAEFLLAKRQYIAATGRVRGKDDIIAYHLRQSFVPGEITPEEANRLGQELARRFTHIIWNAVNLDCDRKFRNFLGSTRAVRRLSDTICIENGYSIVENPKPHSKSYNKWLGDAAKPSHRETLRLAIDRALEQKPTDLDTLLAELKKSGCIVERRGKHITLCAPGWKKPVRLRSLGKGYTQEDLSAVLAGTREHTPRKVPAAAPAAPKVNLLVDIQAKLQAGKGKGYERWAKVFNLKQMAQTMAYLSEHDLLDYAALASKAATAAERHNDLRAQIKSAEKRMEEIGTLRTHIIQYAKTRDTYVAYRKCGLPQGGIQQKVSGSPPGGDHPAQGRQRCLRQAGPEEAAQSQRFERCVCRGAEPKEKTVSRIPPRP